MDQQQQHFQLQRGDNIRFRDILPSSGGTFSKVNSAAQSISMSGQKQGKNNAKQLSLRSQPSALRLNRRRVYPTLWPKWGFLGTLLQEWERGTRRRSYPTYRMSLLQQVLYWGVHLVWNQSFWHFPHTFFYFIQPEENPLLESLWLWDQRDVIEFAQLSK